MGALHDLGEIPHYRDPAAIVADCLNAMLPPRRMSVAEHAEDKRWINAAYVGRFSFERAPYLRGPMEALDDPDYSKVAIPGPGQCGKTTVAECWLLKSVDVDPANFLWFMQTDPGIVQYVKTTIDPMIRDHKDILARRLGRSNSDNTLHFKRFDRMWVEYLSATPSSLINKKAPRIVGDEVDSYDPGLGDPETLIDVRRQTYGRASKVLFMSHADRATGLDPKRDWNAGIMKIYANSTRATWWWPCPECGDFSSPNPGTARHMPLTWDRTLEDDEAAAKTAHLLCPGCGAVIEDAARPAMLAEGFWAHRGQTVTPDGRIEGQAAENETAGFWIVGAMSLFTHGGLRGLVSARLAAARAAEQTGDPGGLKEVMVKRWGIPFDARLFGVGEEVDWPALQARAEDRPLAQVPAGVRTLTAAVDVQKNRFEVQVEGWGGSPRERWLIDRFSITKAERLDDDGDPARVDPAAHVDDWRLLVGQVVTRRYPLADGSGFMEVNLTAVDSGGESGVTEAAYEFYRELRARGLSRRCILVKGDGRDSAPRVKRSFPDAARKDRRAQARGEIPVYLLGATVLKDRLAADLRLEGPGPGYLHYSKDMPESAFQELGAETRGHKRWERKPGKPPNETWILHLYNRAAAILLGLEKKGFWDSPPEWAAPWSENSLVSEAGEADLHEPGARPAPRRKLSEIVP